ncbi:RNA/RNP complex-1-interacting phosphatase-like [Daphnia carinata]|uniref:RNA/RNP complex-1-interacting phosphatase-like n=1 Tax=Daphnia carinata TaxID=120202 RepID=UPI00257A62F4|nr:RNA/RNP complex-1-interacting phosphatase-like [Daphnia carinata]
MGKGKNGLPDRWLDYISIGQEIRGVPIIACKVPLREDMLHRNLRREHWFTPDNLVEMVPNVGCIVDLTATSRYYNPQVFIERGIHHEKIFCEGRVIPKATTVRRFFQVVDEFLHSVNSRGKVLMVHCTHGLNRTGYLVSRYMVERRGFQPADAIAAFNEARGHCIERENYLEDLHRRNTCTDPVPLYQKNDADYHDHDQACASYEHQQERPTSANGFNRYAGQARRSEPIEQLPFDGHRDPQRHSYPQPTYNARPSVHNERPADQHLQSYSWRQGQGSSNRSHGHPSQRANMPSTTAYHGRTESPVPPVGYDGGRQRSSYYYRNASTSEAPAVPNHIRFTDRSLPRESAVHVDNWNDRANSANGDRSRSSFNHLVQQRGNTRPISPSVQVVAERRSNASVSSSSKARERSLNRHHRDVSDNQSTSSIEVCYDSRLVEPTAGHDFRQPSSKEKPRDHQRERSGSEQADRRPSGKKMRHRTAKRLNADSYGRQSNDVD